MSFIALTSVLQKGASLGLAGGPPDEPPPSDETFTERVAALSPDWHLPLNDSSGTTAVAEIGPNGTYVSTVQLGVATLALDDDENTSVGLASAAHVEVTTPFAGTDLTLLMLVQFDNVTATKQILGGQASNVAGGFALEIVTSQVRGYSRVAGNTAHAFTGSAGDVQQGTVHLLAYRRQSGVAPSQEILVDGIVKASDPTVRTWPTVPAGTFYGGAYIDGSTGPVDGLVQHIVGVDRRLTDTEIATLVHHTDSVAHVVNIDAGSITSGNIMVVALAPSDLLREGVHGKLPITATAGNGSKVTTTEAGDDITINAAGASAGADSFSYSITDANANTSGSATISLVVNAAAGSLDNAHNTLVMNAPGQVSDEYIRDSAMYYISTDTTNAMRIAHNDLVLPWRNNFVNSRNINFGAVNDRTERFQSGWNHSAWIEPSATYTAQTGEPVAAYPGGLTHGGVIRHTARYGTDGQGDNGFGGTWNPDGDDVRNFRKDNFFLRHIAPRDGFILVGGETECIYGREYEVGFTIWYAGEPNWHRQEGGAVFQLHGKSPVHLYFRRTGTNWGGFTSSGNQQNPQQVDLPPFPIATGANTIHVLRIQFRLHISTGYVRIWYQGNQVVNVSNRAISTNGNPLVPHLMMMYQNPPMGSNQGETWTVFSDRFYMKAIG